MKELSPESTNCLYTVSVVLQIYENIHTDYFTLSIEEIKEKYESWAKTGHQVLPLISPPR